ncbi:MAG: metallophosphoesterase [Magnetospirillum sp.]|nr:metallophosphoesterase [Magnetospirillum sp.]
MKIVHLTDLHLTADETNPCNQEMDKILARLKSFATANPDETKVIVLTGDIVDKSDDHGAALANVKARYLAPLEMAGYSLVVVPGNHDIGRYDGSWRNCEMVQSYVAPMKTELFENGGQVFPKVEVIDGVAFIVLDSQAEVFVREVGTGTMATNHTAEGELGQAQIEALKTALRRAIAAGQKIVVSLHHEPFNSLPGFHLIDRHLLGWVLGDHAFRGKVSALLFGHTHWFEEHRNDWGIPYCFDGGSSTGKECQPSPVRIIDIHAEPVTTLA